MCGIIGYIGKNNAVDAIMDGLRKLEYRGYDSAGLTVISDGAMDTYKDKGRVAHLNEILPQNLSAPLGIGHTRWATHGKPSKENSHPHSGGSGEISIAHNGIIENYLSLMKLNCQNSTIQRSSFLFQQLFPERLYRIWETLLK